MHKILIAGSGKIGTLIATLLALSGDYEVTVLDKDFKTSDSQRLPGEELNCHKVVIDIFDKKALHELVKNQGYEAVISALPYYANVEIAYFAKEANLHYFDLTEDNPTAAKIYQLAKDAHCAFVPRCGLAPGFIGLVTHDLMKCFDEIKEVKMRVGALPINSNNALQYALTWSTDGLINEYINPCQTLQSGKIVWQQALEGLEMIQIDGMQYEAFHTSGGVGNLVDVYKDKVNSLNYKTIRYPGHRQVMHLLLQGLGLKDDVQTLKNILEKSIPKTYQDVVIIYVAITGHYHGELIERNYVHKIYPDIINHYLWSAMQVTTASSVCAIVDLVMQDAKKFKGFIVQEDFALQDFLNNRFGQVYQHEGLPQ